MKFDFTSGVVLLGIIAILGTGLLITTINSSERTRNIEHLLGKKDVLELKSTAAETAETRKDVLELESTAAETAETTAYVVTACDSITTAQSLTSETTTLSIEPTSASTTTSSQYTVVSSGNVRIAEKTEIKSNAKNSLGEEVICDLEFVDRDDLNSQAILYFDRVSDLELEFFYLSDSCSKPSNFSIFIKSGEESQYQEYSSFTLTKDSLPHKLSLNVPEKGFLLIKGRNAEEYCFGSNYHIGCKIQPSNL